MNAENYEAVTVMFSDVADFQEISASSAPMQIVAFLNELYNFMDSRIERFDVYKVSKPTARISLCSGMITAAPHSKVNESQELPRP